MSPNFLFNILFTYPEDQRIYTYAILDSLRNSGLRQAVNFSDLKFCNLWHEDIRGNTESIPLLLIECEKDNKITIDLVLDNKEALIFFQSPYTIEELQDYYSRFTYPLIQFYGDDWQRGIFGCFDSKILSTYIESLYSEEKQQEFFSASRIWFRFDHKNEKIYSCCLRDSNTMETGFINLSEHIELLASNQIKTPIDHILDTSIEIKIDQRQVAYFQKKERDLYLLEVLQEINNERQLDIDMEQQKYYAAALYAEAQRYGLETESGIYRYISLGLISNSQSLEPYDGIQTLAQLQTEKQKIDYMDQVLQPMT